MEDTTIIEKYTRTSGEYKQVTFQIFDKLTPWSRIYRTQTYKGGVLQDPFRINRSDINSKIFDSYWGEFKEVKRRYELEP